MNNKPTYEELEQKIRDIQKQLAEYKQAEESRNNSNKEELLSRRVEESAVNRIQKHLAIFGAILTVFAIIGLFAFGKYIEISLSDSISRNVNATAQKEIQQISQTVSQKVESELSKIKTILKEAENEVSNTQKIAERIKLETEVRLGSNLERVEYLAKLLIKDVEKHREEIINELRKESANFEEARKTSEKQSSEILNNIRSDLSNLEKLTTVVRAPLSKKIDILRTLTLDKSAANADMQRYIGILT